MSEALAETAAELAHVQLVEPPAVPVNPDEAQVYKAVQLEGAQAEELLGRLRVM